MAQLGLRLAEPPLEREVAAAQQMRAVARRRIAYRRVEQHVVVAPDPLAQHALPGTEREEQPARRDERGTSTPFGRLEQPECGYRTGEHDADARQEERPLRRHDSRRNEHV